MRKNAELLLHWKKKAYRHRAAYLFVLPAVVYFAIFGFYPLASSVWLSFNRLNILISPVPQFIGLQNYWYLFTRDHHFWLVFKNTLVWVVGSTLLQVVVGFLAALLLNKKLRGRTIFRGIMLVPWVTPIVVVGIAWRWILDPHWGLMNYYLQRFGIISDYIVWLGRDDTVWPMLLLASTWKGYSYMCVMILAGLQTISKDLYEAASVEGASSFHTFFKITLPLIRPILAITLLVGSIETWNNFRMIWVMTEGGPGYSTSVLSTYVFTKTFREYQFGRGAAVATFSFLFVLIFSLIYLKYTKAEE